MTKPNTAEKLAARAMAKVGAELTARRVKALGGWWSLIQSCVDGDVLLTEGEVSATIRVMENGASIAA